MAIMLYLLFPITHTLGTENVFWKIYKEKNDAFTIKYPSNWDFSKYDEDSSELINIYFYYQGGNSLAELALFSEQSLFTNLSEMVSSYPVYLQNHPDYDVLQPVQCGKYSIINLQACDIIVTYRDTRLANEPIVKHLIVGTLDKGGVEYIIEYFVTEGLYEHYLPVAKEMIASFNVTGNYDSAHEKAAPDTEELPEPSPLIKSPNIKKI